MSLSIFFYIFSILIQLKIKLRKKMNGKYNSEVIELAIKYGCKTAKDFSMFIKKYRSYLEVSKNGRIFYQPTLFTTHCVR